MKAYLWAVLAAGVLASFAESLIPGDEKLKRAVSVACAVAVLYAIVSPLPGVIRTLPSVFPLSAASWEERARAATAGSVREATEQAIRDTVAARYSLRADEVHVTATLSGDTDAPAVTSLRVTLSGRSALADGGAIARYLRANICEDCEVTIGAGP